MQEQCKIVRSESKGKSSSKVSTAMEEMQYLMNFNSSICQAAAKTMEHLTEFVFISMGNLTLARRDSYLTHISTRVKPDTLAGLRTAAIHIATLFPDDLIKKAEEEIVHFESKGQSSSTKGKCRYHPYERPDRKADRKSSLLAKLSTREVAEKQHTTPRDQPRASSPINDNHCVDKLQGVLLAGSQTSTQKHLINSSVNLNVVNPVRTAPGHSQKKGVSPGSPVCHMPTDYKLKYVKGVSCVTQLCCVNPVTNVKPAAQNLPVGARLHNFWQTWLRLGAGPKVVQILKEGYTLPFRIRPKLARSPTVVSCYVNPHRNSYLLEALHQLIDKNAIELVHNQTSLGFFNRLFLVPKPNQKWRPILDLSKLNLFLKTEKFKMETPETIRTSLQ